MNYRELSQRLRLPLGFALAALYLVFARPHPSRLLPGLLIALVGLAIRAWASGHIAKNVTLSVAGPYAHVRNPLYLGSFLISVGFALVWEWWFVAVVVAFFIFIYAPTMDQERRRMADRFPLEFAAYERNVPAFVPRFTPWRVEGGTAGEPRQFNASLYMRHAEWKAALGFLAGSVWLVLRLKLGL